MDGVIDIVLEASQASGGDNEASFAGDYFTAFESVCCFSAVGVDLKLQK